VATGGVVLTACFGAFGSGCSVVRIGADDVKRIGALLLALGGQSDTEGDQPDEYETKRWVHCSGTSDFLYLLI
jgi:hypothetical protein